MSDGNFRIAVDDERKLVTVTYSGDITIEIRKQAVQIQIELLEKHGLTHLLIDLSNSRMKEQDIEAESNFASMISQNEIFKRCRTAYLTKPEQFDNTLIEILARAKHFNCRRFTSIQDAVEWLAQNNP